MKLMKFSLVLIIAAILAGCEKGARKNHDYGIDGHDLTQMNAGIWVDPNGCDHWIIDDGVEGYLSARLDPYGKPVCSGDAPPHSVVGAYKNGWFGGLI